MILSLEHIWLQSTGGCKLKEVIDEEEAFAEMRRFLEVNQIPSDTTAVRQVEEQEFLGRIIPAHKEVHMRQSGLIPPHVKSYPNPCFGLYYGSDKPRHDHPGTLEENRLRVEKGSIERLDEDLVLMSDSYHGENKWYVPLLRYLSDLKNRSGGDSSAISDSSSCHYCNCS